MTRALASIIVAVMLLMTSCSTHKQLPAIYYSTPVKQDAAIDAAQDSGHLSWWVYRYRVNWPEENDSPDFAVDLLLAHALVEPVLAEYSKQLLWWRFHRRAARKPPGHQFSFMFYSDRPTAIKVINTLDSEPLLAKLKDSKLVLNTLSSDTNKTADSAIEAYSDHSWPVAIQKTWPSYIMGVSAFWLALIDEIMAEQTVPGEDSVAGTSKIDYLLEQYRQIDNEIAIMWQQHGQHVLLHHMSALFGYKPMRLEKDVIY